MKLVQQVKIFCSYAYEDQVFVHQLKTHFALLKRLYTWVFWDDMDISAGAEREQTIQERLDTAQVILLLISPDFMNSDYCYSKEMTRAMERHEQKEACVIPIIIRPVAHWKSAPFGKLQALPADGKPITDRHWGTADHAFTHVVEKISQVVDVLIGENKKSTMKLDLIQIESKRSDTIFSSIPGSQPSDLSLISEILASAADNIHSNITHIKVFEQQIYAYQFLMRMIERYGAKEAILLQYSCHTSLDVLRTLLRKGAKVTVYIQHEDISAKIGSQFQAHRIIDTTMNLRSELGDELLKTKKLKVYKYHVPSSISAIKIDNRVLCMGWYTYEETKHPAYKTYPNDSMELSAHDRAAVVVWQGIPNFQMLDETFNVLEGTNNFRAFDKDFNVLEKNYRKHAEIVPI